MHCGKRRRGSTLPALHAADLRAAAKRETKTVPSDRNHEFRRPAPADRRGDGSCRTSTVRSAAPTPPDSMQAIWLILLINSLSAADVSAIAPVGLA
ncbi:hypothetical protein BJL95_08740 [Methylomonas sp. LWB]|nr:hypothetical protein BJL95_08740 [Methylomonas sp. LWB]